MCYKFWLLIISTTLYFTSFSQNDLDALRYSRTGIGGSPRFIAMGGAMGALGGDVSCATTNPAGLAIFRKGEIIYSGGLRITRNTTETNGISNKLNDANFVFSNFGLAFAWHAEKDPTRRNVFCFSNTQLQNFSNQIQFVNPSTRNTMASDMLNIANSNNNTLSNLNQAYEGLGYNAYLLDYDSTSGKFFSFVDINRNLAQNRSITTSGRANEINISFAQSIDDNFYIGGSVGIPRIKFESTTKHTEADANDSMRVGMTSASSFTSTYNTYLPFVYNQFLGFNSFSYTEFFRTEGYGVNIKLGINARVNQNIRLGAYFHSPTILNLTDTYKYEIASSFDGNKLLESVYGYPTENDGMFKYKITTPLRFGFNSGFIIGKIVSIGVEYEGLKYQEAKLNADDPTVFKVVNDAIKTKYKYASNIRVGGELNVKPVIVRAGYTINGSPFGGLYSGKFDRQTVSFGISYRTKNNYFYDLTWTRTSSKETYYMFSTLPVKSNINYIASSLILAIGLKF